MDHIFKSCLFFHSKLLIPLYYIRTDTKKKFRPIGGGLGVLQALQNIRPKYKGNGHKIGHKFLLAITFYEIHTYIYDHICSGHNGHNGHISQIVIMAPFYMALKRAIKSYGQKKYMSDIMAISFVFWPDILECLVDP